ncbi:MAG: RNA polymerase sigma factor SigZ [Bdellovibrionales bacterium]|nr:RNA polymerase sigma factor SigZ [Bdellovibrionales bacterium]
MGSDGGNLLPILNDGGPVSEAALASLLPKLRGFLAKRISNAADVEDTAQDILLRVYQGAGQLSDETRIHAWIWQIAKNAVIDHYRRKTIRAVDVDDLDLQSNDQPADVEEIVESWLAPMIAALPEPYREAVQLSELEGMAQADVAARLSLSLPAAKSRIQRGRAKLREALVACCQFEFDRNGKIVGYRRIGPDCVPGNC